MLACAAHRPRCRPHPKETLLLPALAAVLVALPLGLVQASLFEWIYHRYWLHRPWLPPQMFTAHTLVHHQLCKHDDTFLVTDEEQEEALTFQWWGGPVLISINLLPWLAAWWALAPRLGPAVAPAFLIAFAAVFLLYYLAYEGFHYLMHKPRIGWIVRSAPFRLLERHHRIHHAHMGRNFTVVLPLAALAFGTLMVRDPLPARATGPEARRVARRHSRFGQRLREQQARPARESARARPETAIAPGRAGRRRA